MSELEVALIAAVVSGVVSWVTTWDQWRRDRARRRDALATALLVDLASIEATVYGVHEHHDRVFSGGGGFPAFATAPETLAQVFTPSTVDLVMHAASLAKSLTAATDDTRGADELLRRSAPTRIAATAYVLATRIAPLKAALEREGGRYTPQTLPELEKATGETFPPLPARAFVSRGSLGPSMQQTPKQLRDLKAADS